MIEIAENPQAIAAVIAIAMAGLAAAVLRLPFFDGKPFFLATLPGIVWWLLAASGELGAGDAAAKLGWAKAAWPGIALVPTAWAVFLHDLCLARRSHARPLAWAIVLLPVALASLAAASNPWHGAFYGTETQLVTGAAGAANLYDHGPLFWATAALLYLYLGFALAILVRAALRGLRPYRALFRALLGVTLLPLAGNLAYVFGDVTLFGFDPTPFLFSMVFLTLGGALLLGRLGLEDTARDVLFERSQDGIVVIAPDGICVGANPAAHRLLDGAIPAVGDPIPHDGPVWSFARDTLATGAPPGPRIVRLGSVICDLRAMPVPRPMADGTGVAGWILSLGDATGLVELSDALTVERDRLLTVMENSGIGFFMIGESGEILYTNSEASRITGRAQEDMKALNYDDPTWRNLTLGGTPMAAVDLPVARVLQTGEPVLKERHAMLRRDGSRRVLSVSAVPLPSATGTQVIASVADVTEEARATDALRKARDRAEAASRAKSRFLALMSHEIRTPLNAVIGTAELLEDPRGASETAGMARTIREAGEALMAMLNDVLDIAQIEEGPLELDARPFRPADIADALETAYAAPAEARGLEWEIYASTGARMPRLGDPERVTQVAKIAVGNAVKFTDQGRVLVTVSGEPGRPVVIEVSDTGPGIEPGRIATLRQPFSQADEETTRSHGGIGLGLAIADGLVRAMGGDLAIHSSPGLGTRVRISLPLPEA